MNYILITPCKNEGENLPKLIQSIVSQTIKPVIWVIIDDASTDNTPQISKEAAEKNDWIKILRYEEATKRDLGLHLAKIMSNGFDMAIDYCKNKNIEYEYLGNVDGDISLEYTFFHNLMREFEKDLELGIASGGLRVTINNKLTNVKGLSIDEPSGGHILIRRKCFEDCDGIPQSYAFDAVIKAKARLNGWKNKRFEDNIATESRDASSAEGYVKGFLHTGKILHYLNFHPLHVFAWGILRSLRRPYYGGIMIIAGYLNSLLKRDEQIEDKIIKNYYWNKWKIVYKQRLFSRVTYENIK